MTRDELRRSLTATTPAREPDWLCLRLMTDEQCWLSWMRFKAVAKGDKRAAEAGRYMEAIFEKVPHD